MEQGLEADSPRCGIRGSPRIPELRSPGSPGARRSYRAAREVRARIGNGPSVRLSEFQIDRPFVERLGATALRSSGAAVSRPCAVAAAVPSSSTFGSRRRAERCRGALSGNRRSGASRDRRAHRRLARERRFGWGMARSGTDLGPDRVAPCRWFAACVLAHVTRASLSGAPCRGVGVKPGVRGTNGRKAAGRSDAERLLASGILRGVWALRGNPRPLRKPAGPPVCR